ncbi:MAG: haloalkane dehalogenase [Acidobacteriota bacterium]
MDVLRTPDERFNDLPDFPYEPHYLEVPADFTERSLRMAWVEAGPADGEVILCLHGEPSWSFLYRKMMPIFAGAGYRVVAPDLIGFGRSDKPTDRNVYTYRRHLFWLEAFLDGAGLSSPHLVCQDWGGLLGLRLAAEQPERFATITAANTFLPTARKEASQAFLAWRQFSQENPAFDIGKLFQRATTTEISDDVVAAYDAPFPDESYKAGARQFPALVPITSDDPEAQANERAWLRLREWRKPFLTAFSDQDPIMVGGDAVFQKLVPGCAGQPHTTIEGGGHFLQEDCGEVLAEAVVKFLKGLS